MLPLFLNVHFYKDVRRLIPFRPADLISQLSFPEQSESRIEKGPSSTFVSVTGCAKLNITEQHLHFENCHSVRVLLELGLTKKSIKSQLKEGS